MMRRYRYNTICCLPKTMKLEQVELPLHSKWTESLADVSAFVPTSESVRNLRAGDTIPSQLYDFPDGKDTGFKVPKARDRRSDIAEISQEIQYNVGIVKDKADEIKKIQDTQKKMQDILNKGSSEASSSE